MSRDAPVYKMHVAVGRGTELYVSARSAAVTQKTTRADRVLAWAGVIPHWFYIAALRTDQPLRYRIVVWTSGIACVQGVIAWC